MDRRELLLSLVSAFPPIPKAQGKLSRALSDGVELGTVDSRLLIVSKFATPMISVAQGNLAGYLTKLMGRPPLLSGVPASAPRQILLGDPSLANEFNLPSPGDRRESFTLGCSTKGNQSLLVISGRTDEGVKRGVYHTMQRLRWEDGKLTFPPGIVQSSPFFAGRGSHLGGFVCDVFNLKNAHAPGGFGACIFRSTQLEPLGSLGSSADSGPHRYARFFWIQHDRERARAAHGKWEQFAGREGGGGAAA